jgi:hypothetical protein
MYVVFESGRIFLVSRQVPPPESAMFWKLVLVWMIGVSSHAYNCDVTFTMLSTLLVGVCTVLPFLPWCSHLYILSCWSENLAIEIERFGTCVVHHWYKEPRHSQFKIRGKQKKKNRGDWFCRFLENLKRFSKIC